jgi:hypothetical protein
MISFLFIIGVLFFSLCLYQLNIIRVNTNEYKYKKWISLIMGLMAVPILKLSDRVLVDFGLKSELTFYLSIILLLIIGVTIKGLTSMSLKMSN